MVANKVTVTKAARIVEEFPKEDQLREATKKKPKSAIVNNPNRLSDYQLTRVKDFTAKLQAFDEYHGGWQGVSSDAAWNNAATEPYRQAVVELRDLLNKLLQEMGTGCQQVRKWRRRSVVLDWRGIH